MRQLSIRNQMTFKLTAICHRRPFNNEQNQYRIVSFNTHETKMVTLFKHVLQLLQLKFSIKNRFCRIFILTTSSLNFLIALVLVPNSHIIRLATLLPLTSILLITFLCEMSQSYQKVRNIVSLNPSIGNTTLKCWWIQSRIMPGNGQSTRRKT